MSFDLFAAITDRIIAELGQGVIPWRKPWIASGAALSHATGRPYSLLNQLLLGRPGEYVTFKQAEAEGGHVRKGEKSRFVVFWKWIEDIDKDTGEIKKHPYLRYYNVFHIDQCEGIKPRWEKPLLNPASPDETAEAIMNGYLTRSGVKLIHVKGDRACYTPANDTITVPEITQFAETPEYYSTLFHEMTHSTGHPKRLNRITSTAFASEAYSQEELVAELGSAFLVHTAGLETAGSFRNSAAYIRGWLKALHDDRRLIVTASGKAEKAVRLILGEEEEQHDDV